MKKFGVMALALCLVFFSTATAFAISSDDVAIDIENAGGTVKETHAGYDITASQELTTGEDGDGKFIEVSLSVKAEKVKTGTDKKSSNKVAQTGDGSPLLLFVGLLLAGAVAAIFLVRNKKLAKSMGTMLCVALLVTCALSGSGIANAGSEAGEMVSITVPKETMDNFDFNGDVTVPDDTCWEEVDETVMGTFPDDGCLHLAWYFANDFDFGADYGNYLANSNGALLTFSYRIYLKADVSEDILDEPLDFGSATFLKWADDTMLIEMSFPGVSAIISETTPPEPEPEP